MNTTVVLSQIFTDKKRKQEFLKLLPPFSEESFKALPTKKFPTWVYANNKGGQAFSHFGFFIDLIIQAQIKTLFPKNTNSTECPPFVNDIAQISDIWTVHKEYLLSMTGAAIPQDTDISRSISLFNRMTNQLKDILTELSQESFTFVLSDELTSSDKVIVGHPDLYWHNEEKVCGVIDFKAISKPLTNWQQHMAQVCTYAALLIESGHDVQEVGIYYPLQADSLVIFELPLEWDHKACLGYLSKVVQEFQKKFDDFFDIPVLFPGPGSSNQTTHSIPSSDIGKRLLDDIQTACMYSHMLKMADPRFAHVGSHMHGCSKLIESLKMMPPNMPRQAFITPNTGRLPDYNITEVLQLLSDKNITHMFSHCPYYINLCHPETRKYPDPYDSLCAIKNELKLCNEMGFRGCVIHVGKNVCSLSDTQIKELEDLRSKPKLNKTQQKKMDKYEAILANPKYLTEEQAYQKMRSYTIWTMDHGTSQCPLLLETPAGQGSEMLTDIKDFIRFCKSIIDGYPVYYEGKNGEKFKDIVPFGICVDTCHVFACGYDPLEYILEIDRELPGMLRLIHFNDSKEPKGSRVDRHWPYATGHIGKKALDKVVDWGLANGVPLVIE